MRMTAIQVQTERKRQDRSARCAEKRRCRARTRRLRGLIRPVPAACATADNAQGEKCLSSGQNQVILTSDSMPLGECRLGFLVLFALGQWKKQGDYSDYGDYKSALMVFHA
jgi:hypothetical protein